ncbi:MAG: SAM-dependent methyltransferase, partial [Actinomycetota bacterium]|nr:SAM-dependent methyltransferase [Actinomycetota bacterium]
STSADYSSTPPHRDPQKSRKSPKVIEFKTNTMAGLGAEPGTERRTGGIDLRDDWPTALRDKGFDPKTPTAWIAEGLLIYLPPEAQDRLFDNITTLSAPGSRVACEQIPDANVFSDMLNDDRVQALAARSRKFGFDMDMTELFYAGDRSLVTDYLAARGWRPTPMTTAELYAANGFTLPKDELMAQFADLSYVSAVLG